MFSPIYLYFHCILWVNIGVLQYIDFLTKGCYVIAAFLSSLSFVPFGTYNSVKSSIPCFVYVQVNVSYQRIFSLFVQFHWFKRTETPARFSAILTRKTNFIIGDLVSCTSIPFSIEKQKKIHGVPRPKKYLFKLRLYDLIDIKTFTLLSTSANLRITIICWEFLILLFPIAISFPIGRTKIEILRSACTPTQCGNSSRLFHFKYPEGCRRHLRSAKTLVILRGSAGWSESSPVAQVGHHSADYIFISFGIIRPIPSIFENGVLLMCTLEGVSSVANFITTYEES